jgi:hypothetical protein
MIRYIQMTVGPENLPMFDERNFTLSLKDEASGEYLSINSNQENLSNGEIKITPEEWEELKIAIDTMIAACKTYE